MNSSAIRIGEVALRSGVSIDTVRYYERRRLLPTAARTEGGFRIFTPDAVERVRLIKQAQELGFSLDEIGELLTTGGVEERRRVRDHLKVKLTPYFIALTVVFLAAGFYFAYRPENLERAQGSDCATPKSRRLQRVSLWVVAILTLALIAFPYLIPCLPIG